MRRAWHGVARNNSVVRRRAEVFQYSFQGCLASKHVVRYRERIDIGNLRSLTIQRPWFKIKTSESQSSLEMLVGPAYTTISHPLIPGVDESVK